MPSCPLIVIGMPAVRAALVISALIFLQASGLAAGDSSKGSEPDKVDTEKLFGFTEGTDTGKKGEQEILFDAIGRFSKRRDQPGRSGYGAAQPIISYQYDPTDNFSIEPGLWFDARDSRNIAGVPDKSFVTFNGGSLELKYQFFKRTDERPEVAPEMIGQGLTLMEVCAYDRPYGEF